MKKLLLLLALTLGTQISATTIREALDEYETSSEFLEIVDNMKFYELQIRNRTKLNKLLSEDILTVTDDQVALINRAIDSFVNSTKSSLKDFSKEDLSENDFTALAENTKTELKEAIDEARIAEAARLAEAIQETELQRLADEAAAVPRLAEEATRAAEAARLATSRSVDMMVVGEESTTDPLAPGSFAQLAETLSTLDEASSSDPDTFLQNYGDEFITKHNHLLLRNEEDYKNALRSFFTSKNVAIDETYDFPVVATKLYDMQHRGILEDDGLDVDGEDDVYEPQATQAAKAMQGLDGESSTDPISDAEAKKARALEKKTRNKKTKNYNVRRNLIMQGNPSEFMKHAEKPLRKYINTMLTKHTLKTLNNEMLEVILENFLEDYLNLKEKDYSRIFPALMEKLVALEEKMWLENHPVAVDLLDEEEQLTENPLEAEETKVLAEQARRAVEDAALFEGLSAEHNQQGSMHYSYANDADNAFAAYQTRLAEEEQARLAAQEIQRAQLEENRLAAGNLVNAVARSPYGSVKLSQPPLHSLYGFVTNTMGSSSLDDQPNITNIDPDAITANLDEVD